MILDPASAAAVAYLPSHAAVRFAVLALIVLLAAACALNTTTPRRDRGGFYE